MTEELKPCPFCGGKGAMVEVAPLLFSAGCDVCRAETGAEEARLTAAASWNRRATPAPAQPEGQEDEPVAWQGRRAYENRPEFEEWRELNPEQAAHWRKHAVEEPSLFQVRALYLHPSRSAGAAAPVEGAAWQPIESVPGTEEPVLLWTRAGKVRVETGWYAKNLLEESKEDDFECSFTHWRPPLAGPASPTPAQEGKP